MPCAIETFFYNMKLFSIQIQNSPIILLFMKKAKAVSTNFWKKMNKFFQKELNFVTFF